MSTPDGRMRLEGHEERVNRTIARQIEAQDTNPADAQAPEVRRGEALDLGPGVGGDVLQDWPPSAPTVGDADIELGQDDDQDDAAAEGGHEAGHGMDTDFMDEVANLAIFNCLAMDDKSYRRERKRAYRRVVSELYPPPRITRALSCLPNASLVPGYALDLTVVDPHDGEPWDFSLASKRARARLLTQQQKPMLVVGSPERKGF